jgi:DNA-binding beta-propeller fold protein YncE
MIFGRQSEAVRPFGIRMQIMPRPLKRSNRIASVTSAAALLLLPIIALASGKPAIFYLSLAGQVVRADADGNNSKVIAKEFGFGPDGIAVDEAAGHVYWTNMGKVSVDDGSILRTDLDGSNLTTIVPVGGTFTPKQLKIDHKHHKLYWSDREGMRIMRANMDGSQIETLVITGNGNVDRKDASHWCVGIALDVDRGQVYWTQKGGDNANQGTIKRASMEIPSGQNATNRSDIEVLFANLPEPIDLDLDLKNRHLYWTDRGDNTISRAPLDAKPGFDPAKRTDRTILVSGLHEVIGIALDLKHQRMFYTSLMGELGTADLSGKHAHALPTEFKRFTGIAYAEITK